MIFENKKKQADYISSKIEHKKSTIPRDARYFATSSESLIYRHNNDLFKIPKTATYHDNIIRSYFIGNIMNNLSCLIPNYVKTLGLFSVDMHKDQVILKQEYIEGETLEYNITKKKIDFKIFLNIFMQVLIALEIAQRQYRFCHYDLHLKNIILKPIEKSYTYQVCFDTFVYTITAEKFIPIIIDFGFSSITSLDDICVGCYDCFQYGMFPFLIQGIDMYKFLFHAFVKTEGSLQREIGELFLFYGIYDPYKVLIASHDELIQAGHDYLEKVSYSMIASYTPLEFVFWILNHPDYKLLLDIKIRDRDIYLPLQSLQSLQCGINLSTSSFVGAKYLEKICEYKIPTNQIKYIKIEKKLLTGYKSIIPIDIFQAKDQMANILSKVIPIRSEYNIDLKEYTDSSLVYLKKFIDQVHLYVVYLYMIKELKLNEFQNFIVKFSNSKQYKIYKDLIFLYNKAERWYKTLILTCT